MEGRRKDGGLGGGGGEMEGWEGEEKRWRVGRGEGMEGWEGEEKRWRVGRGRRKNGGLEGMEGLALEEREVVLERNG